MRLILSGVRKHQFDEKEKRLHVDCDNFEQVFLLEPQKGRDFVYPLKLTNAQLEKKNKRIQAKAIFDYWNEKGIMKHREFGQFAQFLIRKIGKESPIILRQTIDNYVSVYDPVGERSWWTAKWSIKKVLADDRFYPSNFNHDDYRVRGKENDREGDVKKLYEASGISYWKKEE